MGRVELSDGDKYMKNQVIIGYGEGMGQALSERGPSFDRTYAFCRTARQSSKKIQFVESDVRHGIQPSSIPKASVSMMTYIASMWSSQSTMTDVELQDYFLTGPQGFLKSFNALHDAGCLQDHALVVSIGSTAGEAATKFDYSSSAAAYSISKLTQKAITIQLMRKYPQYRFLNLTLGSIENHMGIHGVGYENILSVVRSIYNGEIGIRYAETTLVSDLDVEYMSDE